MSSEFFFWFFCVGAGFPRTGTASTQRALEKVGCGPCNHHYQVLQHQHKDLWSEIHEAFQKGELMKGAILLKRALHEHDAYAVKGIYKSAVDIPAALFWKQFVRADANVKVILTVRGNEGEDYGFEEWYCAAQGGVHSGVETLRDC